ncbi:MAG: hypothetical protein ACI3W6_07300 [Clostridia bacterium]
MMIYDYITPEGRELKPSRRKLPKAEMTVRFLTEEERKAYGCDKIIVVKKRCTHCHEVKSDYAFSPNPMREDGLSSWCRKCAEEERRRREEKRSSIFCEAESDRGVGSSF